jgi:hypothetical protein
MNRPALQVALTLLATLDQSALSQAAPGLLEKLEWLRGFQSRSLRQSVRGNNHAGQDPFGPRWPNRTNTGNRIRAHCRKRRLPRQIRDRRLPHHDRLPPTSAPCARPISGHTANEAAPRMQPKKYCNFIKQPTFLVLKDIKHWACPNMGNRMSSSFRSRALLSGSGLLGSMVKGIQARGAMT